MRTLALLALVLFSSTAPAPAQQYLKLTECQVQAQFILPIEWQGSPALLLVGPIRFPSVLGYGFVSYAGRQLPGEKPLVGVPYFRLVAAHFRDMRPCAPGSPVFLLLTEGIFGPGTKLGEIGANGTLTWTGSPGLLVSDPNKYAGYGGPWLWQAYYCNGASEPRTFHCESKCTYRIDGPEFTALVLVMR